MTACEIVAGARISQVWQALGGGELRKGRGRAWWRNGDGWNIAVDDRRGCWYDHRDGIGGGVLDIIAHVHGGTRQEALQRLAGLTGTVLDGAPSDRMSAQDCAEERRIREEAPYFVYVAKLMAEEALEVLSPTDTERAVYTSLLAALEATLEAEYRAWVSHSPQIAAALVARGAEATAAPTSLSGPLANRGGFGCSMKSPSKMMCL